MIEPTDEDVTQAEAILPGAFMAVGQLIMVYADLEYALMEIIPRLMVPGEQSTEVYVALRGLVATMGLPQKLEIIASKLGDFTKGSPMHTQLKALHDQIKKVSKTRNIVCHCQPRTVGGKLVFTKLTAAKFIKLANSGTDKLFERTIDQVDEAVQMGLETLRLGEEISEALSKRT